MLIAVAETPLTLIRRMPDNQASPCNQATAARASCTPPRSLLSSSAALAKVSGLKAARVLANNKHHGTAN